tara:strand:- start:67 stop:447 length:381 start_codon:yes stop_codon:yes gene_type:complete
MRITESKLRRIIRETIIEEQLIQEGIMKDISMIPVATMFSIIAAFSACTGKNVETSDLNRPEEAVQKIVKTVSEDPNAEFIKQLERNIRIYKARGDEKGVRVTQQFIDSIKSLPKGAATYKPYKKK